MHLILYFILTKDVVKRMKIGEVKQGVLTFIVDRARWVMGEEWSSKTEGDIRGKLYKHLYYTQVTTTRRETGEPKKKKMDMERYDYN